MPWIMPGRVGPPARVACVDEDEQLPRALPTEAVHEIAVTTRRGCCYDAGCEDGWGCDVSSAAAGTARVEAEAGGPDCGDAYAELVPWAEVNGDGWITGPNSDRERCGSLACCPFCFLLPWPFFGVSTLLEEWVVWTRWVDLSTPVEFRFGGGVLEVKSRRNVVCWHREVIPEEAVERVGVFVTPTRWVSRTVAGGGTNQTFELVREAPTAVVTERDARSVRRDMASGCASDTTCDRATQQCGHNCLKTGPMWERPGYPSVYLGAAVRRGGRLRHVRLSRHRWYPSDLDVYLELSARCTAALPSTPEARVTARGGDAAVAPVLMSRRNSHFDDGPTAAIPIYDDRGPRGAVVLGS